MSLAYTLLEKDWLPDPAIRIGIRRLLARRLEEEHRAAGEASLDRLETELRQSPLAIHTHEANEQHYELPTAFFQKILGDHLKYSCGFWPDGVRSLEASEAAMLDLYLERAELADGQEILELGCGWGSLTLYMAERFPRSRILAVSNSASQGEHIRAEARRRGLEGVEVRTADMNEFDTDRHFDRVVSIEMFEHMRNYAILFERIAGWLRPEGKLFVHIFCHRHLAYPFEVKGEDDWMARYFFTGGLMPSADLLPRFQGSLHLEEQWWVPGTHYQRTSEAWLESMDSHRAELEPIVSEVYGAGQARRWWVYWRVFFMACAELFGYRRGTEWGVAHYRWSRGPEQRSDLP